LLFIHELDFLLGGEPHSLFGLALKLCLGQLVVQETQDPGALYGVNQVYRGVLQPELLQAELHAAQDGGLEDIRGLRPQVLIDTQAHADQLAELARVPGGNWVIVSNNNLPIEPGKVLGSEWRVQGAHLIEQASCRPDVTLAPIFSALPDLRAGVIGRTSLC
jgi:hypothetical protein